MDNQLAARLLYQYGYASQEQILKVWPQVGPNRNVIDILYSEGTIEQSIRNQMETYLLTLASPKEVKTNELKLSATQNGSTSTKSILDWLREAREIGATDLHFCTGMPVHWRKHGHLEKAGNTAITRLEGEAAVQAALNEIDLKQFEKSGDSEAVADWPNIGRVRITAMKQRQGIDITARLLTQKIPAFEALGLPESCRELTKWSQGLVLVTGPAGCGKSTTLSTLVEMVNQSRREHILTIEDPIEILYPPGMCQVTQRQVGRHTNDRNTALRAALREDPDILVISELRDLESIQLAVSAAETGHLVFGAMNTNNASRTIYRLIDSFPSEEQPIIRNMVSESLRGILSQQLIPRKDGQGVVPAFEVLVMNSAVANLIRKDEAHQLGTSMITGKSSGMVLLDDSLRALVEKGLIDPEEAWKRAVQPKDFEKFLKTKG